MKVKKNQKWLIFVVLCLAYMPAAYSQYQLTTLAPEIFETFGLSASQFSSLFTAPMIISIFFSIFGGAISDKFGPKRITSFAFVLTIVGIGGRIWAASYGMYFVCMMLVGMTSLFVNTNASKITGTWFTPQEVGMLMGVFALCGQLPSAFATATTAYFFDSARQAYIAATVFAIIVAALWIVIIKEKPEESAGNTASIPTEEKESLATYLKVAMKNRGVWTIAICIMMVLGISVTLSSFLSVALESLYGIDIAKAGTIASMLTLGNCVGAILGPVIFKKVKDPRVFVSGVAVIGFVLALTFWKVDSVTALYALTLLAGTVYGSPMPVFFAAPLMLKGIGVKYAATASGVIATFQLLGAVLIPTYILTPIAGSNYAILFTLSSVCMVIMFVVSFFIPKFENNNIK